MSTDSLDVLPRETYDRLIKPTDGVSRGLPNTAFISDEFLALENERLFKRNWVFVAHGRDVPEPGDVKPLEVAGLPLVLVRNAGGTVNVFHNACRHRGRRLVDSECHGQRHLICPYHRWAYDLDGALQSTPHFGGFKEHTADGFEPAAFGLLPVRCVEWHHWILINLDGDAADFEDYVRPLVERVENWPFRAPGTGLDTLKHVGRIDFGAIKGNWKIIIENFLPFGATVHEIAPPK